MSNDEDGGENDRNPRLRDERLMSRLRLRGNSAVSGGQRAASSEQQAVRQRGSEQRAPDPTNPVEMETHRVGKRSQPPGPSRPLRPSASAIKRAFLQQA
ncbi:hypothetical protein E4U53_006680 [Claviceps sorghi]|nr:hypothetical protein E4U53_006680 [Claviceps sorghi]